MAYTDLEMNILNILANNHGDAWDTEHDDNSPHMDTYELTFNGCGEGGTIFSKNNLDPKVYRGVVSSLIQKGALEVDEYDVMAPGATFVGVRKNRRRMVAVAISFDTFNEIRKAGA